MMASLRPDQNTFTLNFSNMFNLSSSADDPLPSLTPVTQSFKERGIAPDCRLVTTEFTYIPWDNPSNIITVKTMFLVFKILPGGMSPIVSSVGLVANILNAVVFYRQGLRVRINMLLFSLALADLVVEVETLFHTMEYFYMLLVGHFTPFGPVHVFKLNKSRNVLYGSVYVSAFLSTLIACERCLCITHPLKAKQILKTKTAGVIVAIGAVVLMGGHYVIGDKYRIGCVHYVSINLTTTGYIPSPFYMRHSRFVNVLNAVVYGIALPCFLATTTTLMTLVTAIKLQTVAAWRQQTASLSQADKQEVALTKMLVAVSCVFVVCTLPNLLIRIAPFFLPHLSLGGRYQNLYMIFISMLHVTPSINSCLNFFFYLRMGSRFRDTLQRTCCPCKVMDAKEKKETSVTCG